MFLVAEICIVITYIVQLLLPLNLLKLVDEIIKNGKQELIKPVLLTYAGLFVVSIIFNFVYSRVWQKIYNSYTVDIKCAVFEKSMHAQAKELNNMSSGDVMSRIDIDCDQFNEAIFKNVFHFCNSCLLCLSILIIIAQINILISILVFTAALLPMLASQFFNRFMTKYSLELRTLSGDFTGKLFEFFNGFRELKLQQGMGYAESIIRNSLQRFISLGNAIKRVNLAVDKITYFINLLASITIYIYCTHLVANKILTIGGFLVIITYIALLHKKLNWMMRIWLGWHAKKVSVDRVNEILSLPQEDQTGKEIVAINRIDVNNLCFGYNECPVLKNVSFSINKGEKVAIVGVSGVGKTTLIGLLLKLYAPDGGSISLNGENISEFGAFPMRRRYCVVSQEIMLFDTTIRYNLTMGCDITEEKIWDMLKTVGLKEIIEQLTGKLDFVFARGNDLSGGQKQRLMIARAILKNADVYILDEATSALDLYNEKALTDELIYNNIIKTAIVISHRYAAIKNCDKVLVLNEGLAESFSSMKNVREQSSTFNRLFPKVV